MRNIYNFLLLFICLAPIYGQNEKNIIKGDTVIHITTFGTGDPILIINGGPGMNSEGFTSLAKKLGQNNMAIIYDQRGTGKSKIPKIIENTITIDAMVSDIETIRKYLNIDQWIVLGHSFGGMLGSYYTSKFPDKVKGLILSSSGGINMDLFSDLNIASRLTDLERDSLKYWNSQIANGDTTYFTRLQRGKYLAPAYLFDKSNVPIVAHRLTQGNPRINGLVFQNMRKIGFDCAEELKGFQAPVLIIQGKEDIIPKSVADTAKSVLQNSTLVLLEKCGHYGWLDQPDLYFKSVNEFLSTLESKNTAANKE